MHFGKVKERGKRNVDRSKDDWACGGEKGKEGGKRSMEEESNSRGLL
jgi:hypothetical protein